jgi:hypothetical protein
MHFTFGKKINAMKKYLVIAAIGLFAMGACKKKAVPPPPPPPPVFTEENPLPGFLAASGFDQKNIASNYSNAYEEGMNFKPSVNGKITTLVVKLPIKNPSLRVTIWDSSTGLPIRTENVNVTSANTELNFPITPLQLTSGKVYCISFNTYDDFYRTKSDFSDATFPITVGKIIISGTFTKVTPNPSDQIFPGKSLYFDVYYGDLSFKFLQTN